MGKPPALPRDSQSLAFPGVYEGNSFVWSAQNPKQGFLDTTGSDISQLLGTKKPMKSIVLAEIIGFLKTSISCLEDGLKHFMNCLQEWTVRLARMGAPKSSWYPLKGDRQTFQVILSNSKRLTTLSMSKAWTNRYKLFQNPFPCSVWPFLKKLKLAWL